MKLLAPRLALFVQICCLLGLAALGDGCRSKRKTFSAPVYDAPPQSFAEELRPILDEYVIDAAAAGNPVNPKILVQLRQVVWVPTISGNTTLNSPTLGRCRRLNENHPDPTRRYRVVEIAKPDERMMVGTIKIDSLTLKIILYHEFGHCLHDYKGHRPEEEDAIMSARLAKSRYLRLDALIEEHFGLVGNTNF